MPKIENHLRQCEPCIDPHPEVEEDGDHVENLVEHAMLRVPICTLSIGHWEQVS